MSWLADSFLADLEDIEDSTSIKVISEEGDQLPTILTDSTFLDFLANLVPSTNEVLYLQTIEKCAQWKPLIDSELGTLYNQVSNIFHHAFPELEQLVLDPMDYIMVVTRIVDNNRSAPLSESVFAGLGLPHNVIVAITVTAATQSVSLPNTLPSYIRERATGLAAARAQILEFMSAGSPQFFPNLSALLGASLTARLVAAAGGLTSLAAMPSQNIESVGRTLAATGTGQTAKHSLIEQSDLVTTAPVELRRRALRLVLGKTSLAARVDRHGSGTITHFREEIAEALAKAAAPPPARAAKPLPVPVEKPRNKRGGRRARKAKELYGITEVRKRENRMGFGAAATSDYGERDRGMLGVELGHGRIRK